MASRESPSRRQTGTPSLRPTPKCMSAIERAAPGCVIVGNAGQRGFKGERIVGRLDWFEERERRFRRLAAVVDGGGFATPDRAAGL